MASPETICLRRRQLRRRVDEDRVNSTATRRLVHKRRRDIHRNLADEVLQGRGIASSDAGTTISSTGGTSTGGTSADGGTSTGGTGVAAPECPSRPPESDGLS